MEMKSLSCIYMYMYFYHISQGPREWLSLVTPQCTCAEWCKGSLHLSVSLRSVNTPNAPSMALFAFTYPSIHCCNYKMSDTWPHYAAVVCSMEKEELSFSFTVLYSAFNLLHMRNSQLAANFFDVVSC